MICYLPPFAEPETNHWYNLTKYNKDHYDDQISYYNIPILVVLDLGLFGG